MNLQPRDLLFIDEIHRLTRVAEELLYPAMEDRRLDLTVGKGSTARVRSSCRRSPLWAPRPVLVRSVPPFAIGLA